MLQADPMMHLSGLEASTTTALGTYTVNESEVTVVPPVCTALTVYPASATMLVVCCVVTVYVPSFAVLVARIKSDLEACRRVIVTRPPDALPCELQATDAADPTTHCDTDVGVLSVSVA